MTRMQVLYSWFPRSVRHVRPLATRTCIRTTPLSTKHVYRYTHSYNSPNLDFDDFFNADESQEQPSETAAADIDSIDYTNIRKYLRRLLMRVHPDKLRGYPSSVLKMNEQSLAVLNDFVDIAEQMCCSKQTVVNGVGARIPASYKLKFFYICPNQDKSVLDDKEKPSKLLQCRIHLVVPSDLQAAGVSLSSEQISNWREFVHEAICNLLHAAEIELDEELSRVAPSIVSSINAARLSKSRSIQRRKEAEEEKQFEEYADRRLAQDRNNRAVFASDLSPSGQDEERKKIALDIISRTFGSGKNTANLSQNIIEQLGQPLTTEEASLGRIILSDEYSFNRLGLETPIWNDVRIILARKFGLLKKKTCIVVPFDVSEDEFFDVCDVYLNKLRRISAKRRKIELQNNLCAVDDDNSEKCDDNSSVGFSTTEQKEKQEKQEKQEFRIDATDGMVYTLQDFITYYGTIEGREQWKKSKIVNDCIDNTIDKEEYTKFSNEMHSTQKLLDALKENKNHLL